MSVTLADHKGGWLAQISGTAVEPSSLDFDHYKCSSNNDKLASVDLLLRTAPLMLVLSLPPGAIF